MIKNSYTCSKDFSEQANGIKAAIKDKENQLERHKVYANVERDTLLELRQELQQLKIQKQQKAEALGKCIAAINETKMAVMNKDKELSNLKSYFIS